MKTFVLTALKKCSSKENYFKKEFASMVLPLPPRAPHRKKIKWSLPHAEYYNLGMTKKPSPPSQYQLIASL